jgi:hypothetical protein
MYQAYPELQSEDRIRLHSLFADLKKKYPQHWLSGIGAALASSGDPQIGQFGLHIASATGAFDAEQLKAIQRTSKAASPSVDIDAVVGDVTRYHALTQR